MLAPRRDNGVVRPSPETVRFDRGGDLRVEGPVEAVFHGNEIATLRLGTL
ncbi:MAG TPA: hypothetical protein VG371_04565 [Solirubrobacteraceae bacterium]|jgi:hypothetical protein|nr:hypothetical protein [Solirubrobacteraceae bacterium]